MNSVKKKNKWLALVAVMTTYSFAFLTRYVFSPLQTDIANDLSITIAKAGFFMTFFMVGYLLMQIPGGMLADRLKPKYILMVDLVISTICTALMSKIQVYGLGLLLRALIGLSCGSVYSCSSKIITYYFDKKELNVAMGCLLAAGPLGIVIANSVGEPFSSAYGWRATFIATAVIGAVAFVMMLLFVDPFSSTSGKLELKEMLVGVKAYLADKQQIILGLSGFMLMFVTVGFAHWTNTYLETIGLTGEQGGIILTVYSISGIIFSCLSGSISKKLNIKSKKFIIITEAIMLPLTILFALFKSYWALMIVGIFYGAFTYLPSTHYVSLAMDRANEKNIAVTAALQNLIFQFGALVQSALIGLLIDGFQSYSVIWISFAVACVLEVLFIVIFKEKENA